MNEIINNKIKFHKNNKYLKILIQLLHAINTTKKNDAKSGYSPKKSTCIGKCFLKYLF